MIFLITQTHPRSGARQVVAPNGIVVHPLPDGVEAHDSPTAAGDGGGEGAEDTTATAAAAATTRMAAHKRGAGGSSSSAPAAVAEGESRTRFQVVGSCGPYVRLIITLLSLCFFLFFCLSLFAFFFCLLASLLLVSFSFSRERVVYHRPALFDDGGPWSHYLRVRTHLPCLRCVHGKRIGGTAVACWIGGTAVACCIMILFQKVSLIWLFLCNTT